MCRGGGRSPQVEETRRVVAVEHLQLGELRAVEDIARIDALHDVGQTLQLGAVRHANRPVGVLVRTVEAVERLADVLVVGLADQVAPHQGVGESVGHDFARRADEVARDVAQVVGHLDRRHVAVVEEDVLHLHAGLRDALGQRGDVGPVLVQLAAEPAGQCRTLGRILPVLPLARSRAAGPRVDARDGEPGHAVAANRHGVALGGGRLAHLLEDGGDALGRGEVGRRIVGAVVQPDALPVVVVELEELGPPLIGHEEDHEPRIAEVAGGDGLLHVGEVLLEERGEVARPGHVHEQRLGRRGHALLDAYLRLEPALVELQRDAAQLAAQPPLICGERPHRDGRLAAVAARGADDLELLARRGE